MCVMFLVEIRFCMKLLQDIREKASATRKEMTVAKKKKGTLQFKWLQRCNYESLHKKFLERNSIYSIRTCLCSGSFHGNRKSGSVLYWDERLVQCQLSAESFEFQPFLYCFPCCKRKPESDQPPWKNGIRRSRNSLPTSVESAQTSP